MGAMRSLIMVMLYLVGSAWGADPNTRMKTKACPATRAEAKPGTACTATKPDYCDYPGGKWCACEAASCVTAAGPVPGCESKLSWVCRDDGCPHAGVRDCRTEGQQCAYDDGLCASSMVCTGKKWVSQGQQCRPAARPQP